LASSKIVFEAAVPHWREAQQEMQSLLGSEDLAQLHDLLDQTLLVLADA
jgi:hypothetical protein